jgi:hypothetical protein
MDCALLLQRAFQAIDFVDVRSGILPPQSGLSESGEPRTSRESATLEKVRQQDRLKDHAVPRG